MRWSTVRGAAIVVALGISCYASVGFAQQQPDPMEGVAPQPSSSSQPAPTTTTFIPAPAPTPPPAKSAQTTPATPPQQQPEKRTTITTFGIGPTWFLQTPTGSGARWSSPGVMLQVGARIPIEDNFGLGLRFAWGFTEFRRFSSFAKAGYDVGEWSTHAYRDVYNWAAIKDDARVFRWMGAFFAFAVLWIPYIVAGAIYVLAPFATTTYLQADITFNYDIGSDRKGSGPYFKGGLGLFTFLHPQYDTLHGGVGPTAGIGVRVGAADIGVNGLWSPSILHGESKGEHTNVWISSFTLGVSSW